MTSLKIFPFNKLKSRNWIIWSHLSVVSPFSVLWKSSTASSTLDEPADKQFLVFETYCQRWVFSTFLLPINQKRFWFIRATIKRRWLSYLPARISAAFSTGKMLGFTPGGVAKFQTTLFNIVVVNFVVTTIMRETFSFPAQRLAT